MDYRYGPGFLPYHPPVAIAARGLGKLGGMLDIPINGDSIKLGQFIKLASLMNWPNLMESPLIGMSSMPPSLPSPRAAIATGG